MIAHEAAILKAIIACSQHPTGGAMLSRVLDHRAGRDQGRAEAPPKKSCCLDKATCQAVKRAIECSMVF